MIDRNLIEIRPSADRKRIEILLPGVMTSRRVASLLPEGWEDFGGQSDPYLTDPVYYDGDIVACSEWGGSPITVLHDVIGFIADNTTQVENPEPYTEYGQDSEWYEFNF